MVAHSDKILRPRNLVAICEQESPSDGVGADGEFNESKNNAMKRLALSYWTLE
jgi:hypothetical protein